MARPKETHLPWESPEAAAAKCIRQLGAAVYEEALGLFKAAFVQPPPEDLYSARHVQPREVTATVADCLSVMERSRGVKFQGGTAVLLGVASGGLRVVNRLHFDKHRLTWHQALQRARKRKKVMDGPHLGEAPAASTFGALAYLDPASEPRAEVSAAAVLAAIRIELSALEKACAGLQAGALLGVFHGLRDLRSAALRSSPRRADSE